jgi:hypothetical protein
VKCPQCGFTSFDHLPHCKKCRSLLPPKATGNAALRPLSATPAARATKPVSAIPSSALPPLPAETAPLLTARQHQQAGLPLPDEDGLPPLPTIKVATAQAKGPALPRAAPIFDQLCHGLAPGSSPLLPPLDYCQSAGNPFTDLPALQEVHGHPPVVQHRPAMSEPTETLAVADKTNPLPAQMDDPVLARERAAAGTGKPAPVALGDSKEESRLKTAALAIDLLLPAVLFLLLAWMGVKFMLQWSGMLRGLVYGLLLAGVYGSYFTLVHRMDRGTPGLRLLRTWPPAWRGKKERGRISSSRSFPGR